MSEAIAPFDIRLEKTPLSLTHPHSLASIALCRESAADAISTGLLSLSDVLGDARLFENWYAQKPVQHAQYERLHYAINEEILFGYAYFRAQQFKKAVFGIYKDLLQLLTQHNYALLRVWNYLPQLSAPSDYQTFCDARARAFRTLAPSSYCAATVIGTASDSGTVYFIAAPEPGLAIDNPRQVSPHLYPEHYVKPAPLFARATLKQWQSGVSHLYISGTAAIVGHRTVHHNEAAIQFEKLAQNIKQLLAQAAKIDTAYQGLKLHQVQHLKLYLAKRALDDSFRTLLQTYFADLSQVQIFYGQMCRADLLVEAEGMVRGANA